MRTCDRCGREMLASRVSWFNTETICVSCQAEEEAHPKFAEAKARESEAVRAGNMNFPGIGLPPGLRAQARKRAATGTA